MFTIEDVYGCTREEFCNATDTPLGEMAERLRKEVAVLNVNLAVKRHEYRVGGLITDEDQRTNAKLIKVIEHKIESKSAKIRDIKRYLETK